MEDVRNKLKGPSGPINEREITADDIVIEELDEMDQYETSERDYTVEEMKSMNIPLSELFEIRGLRFAMQWDNAIRVINNRLVKGKKVSVNTKTKIIIKLLGKIYPTFL